jgi:hypothetical protein
MPRIGQGSLEQATLPTSPFGFSAIRMEDLEALGNEWTLVQIKVDKSGSTDPFKRDMEKVVSAVVEACQSSPRKDFLLLRVMAFDNNVIEVHGFQPLAQCDPASYAGCLGKSGGSTALYQSSLNGAEAILKQAEAMAANQFTVNAIDIDITDGGDTEGVATPAQIAKVRQQSVTGEKLESLVSILVGVNVQNPQVGRYLKRFEQEGGFSQYVELDRADAKTLARLADFVSQSVSSQSQSLGTGGPSKSLVF